jgi:nucleoside-diphosphate-sugar epimerase
MKSTARRLLLVGFGNVAARLVGESPQRRWQLGALVRSCAARERATRLGLQCFTGDLADQHSLARACAWAQAIVHLAPPPNLGTKDLHTQHLLAQLGIAGKSSMPFCYVSTTGVYGDARGAKVWETTPLNTQTARGLRRVDAEGQLRKAAATGLLHLTILRAPGIYAQDRLPIERLKAGTPALLPEQDMWTNHIHANDLARMALAALDTTFNNRVYNAVDYSDMKMGDYFDLVADRYSLPRPPRVAREALINRVSPMMLSFMSESRRMLPKRLVNELRFKHRYTSVLDALA